MTPSQVSPTSVTPAEQVATVTTTPPPPAVDPPALSAPPGVDTILHVLRRRWHWIVGGGIAAILVAATITLLIVPGRYSAHMVLEVRTHGNSGDEDLASAQRAQAFAIKDPKVLKAALDQPKLAELYHGQSRQDMEAWLQKDLVVDFPAGTAVTRVTLTGDNADQLAPILLEIAEAYQDKCNKQDAERAGKEISKLEEDRTTTSKELRKLQGELADTEKAAGYESASERAARREVVMRNLESVTRDRLVFQTTLRKAVADWCDALVSLEDPESIVVNSGDIDALFEKQATYQSLQMDLALAGKAVTQALKVTGGVETEDVRKARKHVADVQAQITAMRKELAPEMEKRLRETIVADLRKNLKKLESEAAQAHSTDDALAAEIQRLEALQRSLLDSTRPEGHKFDKVFDLQDKVQTKENTLKMTNDKISHLQLAPATPQRLVLEEPSTPTSADQRTRVKYTLVTAGGAFGLVFLAVVLVEYSGRRVYSGEDVRRGLGLPLLGTLPSVSFAARRPLADDATTVPPEQGALLAAVDAIRTTILHAGQSRPLRVLMITSAGMGEGKTSLAVQLAASLARSWRRVLLVDGDLRNPSVHQHFNVASGPGLSEILRGEVHGDEAVQATSLNRLSLLPAGRCDRHALEALSQESLGDIFAGFKDLYDFVILDVGPVLPVSDALQFGHHVDGVVLSVLRDVTRLPDLWATRQRLSALNIPILGAVVVGGRAQVYGGVNPAPLRLNG